MSDLISRQMAIEVAMQDVSDKRSHDFNAGATRAANRIKLLPTVEAELVRQGRWVEYPECLKYENAYGDIDIVCSCCEAVFNVMDNDTYRFDYCPHCGAKMDERK